MDELVIFNIRRKRLQGKTYNELCDEFKMPLFLIRIICKNIKWKNVPLGYDCSIYKYTKNSAKGSRARAAKLKEHNVRSIRKFISEGVLLKQIAGMYRVSISTISDIKTHRSWHHLP